MTKNEIYKYAKRFVSEETFTATVSERIYANIHAENQERGLYTGIGHDDTQPFLGNITESDDNDIYIDYQVFSETEYKNIFGNARGKFPRLILVLRNSEAEMHDAMV